jgi:ParB family chromosome partitioning protein
LAKKRHGGLGRGLDALIPQERLQEPIKEETKSITPVEQQSVNGSEETADQIMQTGYSKETADRQLSQMDRDPASESGVRTLRLSQIDPNRSQPRQNFEDEALEELADSISQLGVLQPILVQKKGNRYEIIAGERRWRASRKAGLTEIPAIIRDYSDQETLELSLIENIQRQDLNPIEEAKAFRRLVEEFSLRQEDLAVRVSKSRTAITNSLRLLKLDERVQDMIVQGQISMGHARALIPVEIPEEQYLIAQQIAEKHLSVRDVEKLIKARLSGRKKKKDSGKDKTAERDPALELAYKEIEERLKQSLGTKTTIRHSGDGTGKLEIEFYSHEDLEKIVDMLT